ncbi:hypothetical protein HNQ91_003597 [Filimonas zeae]|nr:hypothetical protein [Filimonas zeae]
MMPTLFPVFGNAGCCNNILYSKATPYAIRICGSNKHTATFATAGISTLCYARQTDNCTVFLCVPVIRYTQQHTAALHAMVEVKWN